MRNPLHEQALKRFGVEFEYVESVPISDINTTRGKQLQARLVPLNDDVIEKYKAMNEDGSEPPPLLLCKPGRGMFVPLDGNQRIAANERTTTKKRRKAFDAYIVKTDDPMVMERLCWQFNDAVNGMPLSYEERLNHAISFCRKYNAPVTKTAQDYGVKGWELAAKVREAELRDMAGRKDIDTSRVAQETILALHPLGALGDDVAVKAIKTVASSGIDYQATKDMVSAVAHAKTSEAKKRVVDEWAESDAVKSARAATKGGRVTHRRGRSPRERLLVCITTLESLFDEFQLDSFKGGDKARWRSVALKVSNALITLYGLGSLVKGQGVE